MLIAALDITRIYVDTPILHYLIAPPQKAALANTLSALKTAVGRDRIDCITSVFTLFEEYDKWKGRAFINKALKEGNITFTSRGIVVNNEAEHPSVRSRVQTVSKVSQALIGSYIRKEDPADWPADIIELFCKGSNLLWPDACHLAFALVLRCEYFLTNDGEFFSEIKDKLNSREQKFHRQLAEKLEILLALPRERLQKPLIKPLLLKDPSTGSFLSALARG